MVIDYRFCYKRCAHSAVRRVRSSLVTAKKVEKFRVAATPTGRGSVVASQIKPELHNSSLWNAPFGWIRWQGYVPEDLYRQTDKIPPETAIPQIAGVAFVCRNTKVFGKGKPSSYSALFCQIS